jgi:hypothetical protein
MSRPNFCPIFRVMLTVGLLGFLGACGSGGGGGSMLPTVMVTVSPATAMVPAGTSETYQASVVGSLNTTVSWEVHGAAGGNSTVGTITSAGVYAAPAAIPSPSGVTITAVAAANPADTGSAAATIGPDVVISPNLPTILTFGSVQFTATVTGTSNTTVTWQITCGLGGTACGAISSTGLYLAPNSVPTKVQTGSSGSGSVVDTVTVSAVSQANTSFVGTTIATVIPSNRTQQALPIPLGTSGSNANDVCPVTSTEEECSTGTLGSLVTRGGTQYILSNNHVLARSDGATVGDAIIQPGLGDNPAPNTCTTAGTNTVANLSQFVNLQANSTATADAAIAQVVTGAVDSTGAILGLATTATAGTAPGTGAPAAGSGNTATLNESVAKSGRSTGLTCDAITGLDTTVSVSYTSGCSTTTFSETYTDELVVDSAGFSAEGDSGSLIVDANTAQPVALLFAGDAVSSVANPIGDVLPALADSNSVAPTFVGGAEHPVAACSLPAASAIAKKQSPEPAVASEVIESATAVRNRHAATLLAIAGVTSVGVGAALDAPGSAAVVVFLRTGASHHSIPAELEGVRTRIVEIGEGESAATGGLLDAGPSAELISRAGPAPLAPLPSGTVKAAIAIKQRRVGALMADPAIRAVGVGVSADDLSEAALVIYYLKGKAHNPAPNTIDGLRTRLRETTGFHAGISQPALSNGTNAKSRGCPASVAPALAKRPVH